MRKTLRLTLPALLVLACLSPPAPAQPPPRQSRPVRSLLPFHRAWSEVLPDPVRLIEVGPATDGKQHNLVMIVGSRERNDPKRRLRVAHWDGFKFASDFEAEYLGTSQEALLLGHFRAAPVTTLPAGEKPKPPKDSPAARQIVTAEGVYEWTGGTFARLFEAPADVKLALILDKSPDQLLVGAGDKSIAYEVGEKDVHPSAIEPPADGSGYVRYGMGLQDFPGSEALTLASGVRYMQSHWAGRNKWLIGLRRGQPAELSDAPNATTDDRLTVFIPNRDSRGKSFWETGATDLEEGWISEPLPGRVLDVRVGDPKNEGREGILVLTAEDKDRVFRLHFFALGPGN